MSQNAFHLSAFKNPGTVNIWEGGQSCVSPGCVELQCFSLRICLGLILDRFWTDLARFGRFCTHFEWISDGFWTDVDEFRMDLGQIWPGCVELQRFYCGFGCLLIDFIDV